MSTILEGKPVAVKIDNETSMLVSDFYKKNKYYPKLDILISQEDNNPSDFYMRSIIKKANNLNIETNIINIANINQEEFNDLIDYSNENQKTCGVIIMQPLPAPLDIEYATNNLLPVKDVDCISGINISKCFIEQRPVVMPATVKAVLELIDFYNIDIHGKNICIIGRSNVVGRPLANILITRCATVTICHSKTVDISKYTKAADIIITAAGVIDLIGEDNTTKDQIIIDVGTNVKQNGELCGDANFSYLSTHVSQITPVPGGVGAITTSALLNTLLKISYLK